MGTALRLELSKCRRLRVLPAALVLGACSALIGAMNLFSASGAARIADPSSDLWEQLSLAGALPAALFGPLASALMASLMVDVEHSGSGWNLNAAVGLAPGRLLRVKMLVLAALLALMVLIEAGGPVAIALAMGAQAPLAVGTWLAWAVSLWAVLLALGAGHALVSALVPNQLVGAGAGLVGSFIAVYMLLSPPVLARLVPWGYIAVITPVRQDGAVLVPSDVPWAWVVGFLGATGMGFWAATARLDRIEQGEGPAVRTTILGRSARLRAQSAWAPARSGPWALLATECLKTRRGATWAVVAAVPVLTVVSGAVNYVINAPTLSSGWESYTSQVTVFYGLFFASIALALLASAAWRSEHRSASWTMMCTTPRSVAAVVTAKTLTILVPFTAMQALLLGLTWAVGAALGLGPAMPATFAAACLLAVPAALPLAAIQSALSMRLRSFAAPVVVCLGQLVVGTGLTMKGLWVARVWPTCLVSRALTLGSRAVADSGRLDVAGILVVIGWALALGALTWGALILLTWRR